MPRDSNGVYTKPANTTAVTGTSISSSAYNTLADDEANALTDSLSRSGKGAMQADLNMSAKKVTALAAATADSDAVRFDQMNTALQANTNFAGTTTGSSSAYQGATTPAITAYLTGRLYSFIPHVTSAANPTLSINSKGPKAIRLIGNALPPAGTLVAGTAYLIEDIGSTFQLLSVWSIPGTAAGRDVGTASGNLTEVVDGAGNLNSALNIANRQLTNLTSSALPAVIWSSVTFAGATGAAFASFNSMTVTRAGVGQYNLAFPTLGTANYSGSISIDAVVDVGGASISSYFIDGTRSATGIALYVSHGTGSHVAFDAPRVSVSITKIG